MNKIIVVLAMLLGVFDVSGKPAVVEWLNKEVDLGAIQETDGKVSAEFKFVNNGKKSLKISKVQLSCGCTEVEYPQGEILKGDTAVIKLIYNPEDRMGKFDRSSFVYFDKGNIPERIQLSGNVIPTEETLKILYPYSIGDIYFDSLQLDFGIMERGLRRRQFIDIYNAGDEAITPSFFSSNNALSWSIEPKTLEPGDKGLLTVYLDSSRTNGFGNQTLELKCDMGNGNVAPIKVYVNLNH